MNTATWNPIENLDKKEYNFILVYDSEQDVARLALWNPSSKKWEEPPPEQMNITHYMELPESLTPRNKA